MKLSTVLPNSQFVRCSKRLCRGTGQCVTGLGLHFCVLTLMKEKRADFWEGGRAVFSEEDMINGFQVFDMVKTEGNWVDNRREALETD